MTDSETPSGEKEKKQNPIRRLYNWVVSWADSPYGVWALFIIALMESSVFPIPPDVLLLALAFGAPRKSFKLAAVCAVGSVIGAVVGYFIGWYFFDTVGMWVVETYGSPEKVQVVKEGYESNAFGLLMLAGFSPIPFKLFTVFSGMMKIPLTTLIIASGLSRTARFMLVATFVYFLGEKAKEFIDKYFDILTIVFSLMLVGGFVVLKAL